MKMISGNSPETSEGPMQNLKCSMTKECTEKVSYIDTKGFIYCECHGKQRSQYVRTRKMTKREIKTLEENKQIDRF